MTKAIARPPQRGLATTAHEQLIRDLLRESYPQAMRRLGAAFSYAPRIEGDACRCRRWETYSPPALALWGGHPSRDVSRTRIQMDWMVPHRRGVTLVCGCLSCLS